MNKSEAKHTEWGQTHVPFTFFSMCVRVCVSFLFDRDGNRHSPKLRLRGHQAI